MEKMFVIGDYSICRTIIGIKEYKLTVFQNDKTVSQFEVSWQSNNSDVIAHSYKIAKKDKNLPEEINNRINEISDWLIAFNDFNEH